MQPMNLLTTESVLEITIFRLETENRKQTEHAKLGLRRKKALYNSMAQAYLLLLDRLDAVIFMLLKSLPT